MSAECRDLEQLHPIVKELILKTKEKCKTRSINMGIGETYRTNARQDYLYAQGRTRGGNIVTHARGNTMSSYHQWHLAVDFFNNVKGKEYDLATINMIGQIGASLGFEWGGNWTGFIDRCHFQYTFGLTIAELKAGQKPPTNEITADLVLEKAVSTLTNVGLTINTSAWNSIKRMQTSNVEALLQKIGAKWFNTKGATDTVNVMFAKGIISDKALWLEKRYEAPDIRALLIKLSLTV